MLRTVTIADGIASASIVPALGAGLSRYDLMDGGNSEPLLRPSPAKPRGPFELALNLLIPWSNRISTSGFSYNGQFHTLAPNLKGEPYPIHGDAFQGVWSVVETTPISALLRFSNHGTGPFFYDAEVLYLLDKGALTLRLKITSRSKIALPFGFGFHPWFIRSRKTRLTAPAKSVWLEDARHLPAGVISVQQKPEWDFTMARVLPAGWINNGFEGWSGTALIEWPDRRLSLSIVTDSKLSTYVVYSPSSQSDFFCFEPVSHPVDAHNLPCAPRGYGLTVLTPGESIVTSCVLTPSRTFPAELAY